MSKTLPDGGPQIPHFDKFLHFSYFSFGGILFATWLLLKKTTRLATPKHLLIPLIALSIIGVLDEYHQSFTPGRSGNDPFDWLADVFGALFGIIIANRFHGPFRNFSSRVTKMSQI
ncbi:VanZ family protein [Luteolibacter algae]|uniref:VanZ family protein n=1 Tax=Luteolibacter algae TaxID=454151 RepID=A0ABW5DAA2_9BACT